jgi:uncharacterized protein with FMN-binding domain
MKYIKTLFLPVALVVAFIAYVVYGRSAAPTVVTEKATDTNTPSSVPVSPVTTATTPPPVKVPVKTPPPVTKNKYKDGTFTGDVTDAFYGNTQVAAVISGGKITDVQFIVYPNDRQTSSNISQKAMVKFKSEVIAAQSAQVNLISGATQTTQGFIDSMKTALTKALNS